MKKSKEYSPKVKRLFRSLKKQYKKPLFPEYEDPIDALVYAILCEKMTEKAAQTTLKRFRVHFIDFNELRVSRTEEIAELIDENPQTSREIAQSITRVLNSVFNKYSNVSLETLNKTKKRSARQILEKFNGITPFAVNYCMLTALQAHAVPLTGKMVEFLKRNECLYSDADVNEVNAFLTRLIPAKNAYEFYTLVRRKSEASTKGKKKTARKTKKKTKRKTKRKKRKK